VIGRAAVAVVAAVLGAAVPGRGAPTPESAGAGTAAKVLIASYPGLQWDDIARVAPPVLDGLLARSAVASLSVRTAGATTTPADGYVTIGAGNRAGIPSVTAGHAADAASGGVVVPQGEVTAARRDADRRSYDAVPGALGSAVAKAGMATGVIGSPEAALAVMDSSGQVTAGTVAARDQTAPASIGAVFDRTWATANVVLVEMADMAGATTSGERAAALERSDATLGEMLARTDPRTDLVAVVAPAPPPGAAGLTVFAMAGPGIDPGLARSATTRRDGYVTLPDVGVTVLHALGVGVPDPMTGTAITSSHRTGYSAATARHLADANTTAVFRDATVGPLSTLFVALQVATYALAIMAIGRHRAWLLPVVAGSGLVIMAIPAVAFLAGLARYDHLGVPGYTLAVVAAAVAVAALAALTHRRHPLAPVVTLAAVNWIIQVGDIITGGRLQLNTTFGYSPIVAGRFQGFGNLAFAVLVGAAIVLAASVWGFGPRRGAPRDPWWLLAVAILATTVVVDGWPAFGSDVGGVLASVPAFTVLAIMLGGWRLTPKRVLGIVVSAALAVALFAGVDLLRPVDQRTHLGRFVAGIGDGTATSELRRKVEANWQLLTASIFSLLVPVLVVGFVVLITRRRGTVARVQAAEPGLRAGLVSAVIAGVVGFAVNDSGVAIPAMMIGMVVPWMLAVVMAAPSSGVSESVRATAPAVGAEP
jgi:hypothetical protein